jgi:undecaprenyl-diphosphatase
MGNTEIIIATCVVVTAVLLWRTRDWRFSAVPAIAISLQATIFVIAANMVGRVRPPVLPEDPSPPTSSFPSGHVGASTALYASFALLAAERIERDWLRRLVVGLCVLVPLLVASARLYRGAHHLSDVLVGALNGLICAFLAYGWYRHRARETKGQLPREKAATLS